MKFYEWMFLFWLLMTVGALMIYFKRDDFIYITIPLLCYLIMLQYRSLHYKEEK